MNDREYLNEIAKMQEAFACVAQGSSVGVVVPAAMNIVLSAVLAIDDKPAALAAIKSLRPMIEYMQAQVEGVH